MTIPYRRKREGKTDYNKRRRLISSGELRLVIRRSNKNVNIQIVKYENGGDKVLISANTRELIKRGWQGSRSNLPAAYLTGLLAGRKAQKQKIKKAILDVGIHTPVKGSLVYGALKGVIDGGVEVPHSEDVIPKQERIEGKHIMLNTKTKFTKTNKEKTVEQFKTTKEKIMKE
ncbi:MAG: 50S ribosomal protein L18 [Candidatus Nanoarchaeia archaeon]